MPKITEIAPQKKNGEFYNIFVDDQFVCGLSSLQLSNLGLRYGQELSQVEIDDIVQQAGMSKAYNAAIRYISYRPRSIYEVEFYLQGKEYIPATITSVIAKLRDVGLLNDEEFARSWVASRRLTKPRSRRVLQIELAKKHIDKNIVELVLGEEEEDSEQDNLRVIALKKLRLVRFAQDRQKLTSYLVSQGYNYSLVKTVLDELVSKNNKS